MATGHVTSLVNWILTIVITKVILKETKMRSMRSEFFKSRKVSDGLRGPSLSRPNALASKLNENGRSIMDRVGVRRWALLGRTNVSGNEPANMG